MDTQIFKKIIKESAVEILSDTGLYSNSTKRQWYDDNGYYITELSLYPCKLGGVSVTMSIFPVWSKTCSMYYCDESTVYPGRYTGDIESPEVPNFYGALLYYEYVGLDYMLYDFKSLLSPEDFEKQLKILLKIAKRKFEVDYKVLQDPQIMIERLRKKRLHDISIAKEYGRRIHTDTTYAIFAMNAGNEQEALDELSYDMDAPSPENIEISKHINTRKEWLNYINDKISKGRKCLFDSSKTFKFLDKKTFEFKS